MSEKGEGQESKSSGCIAAGVDLGPQTEPVLAYAALLGRAAEKPVHIVYVMDFLLTPPAYLSGYLNEELRREEEEMAAWQERLRGTGVEASKSVLLGRLHESFLKMIAEERPGALVIGYESHALRPSSSERLIASLPTPMLVVRGKKSLGARIGSVVIRSILCAVDFSDASRQALSTAIAYGALFSAGVRVLHVIASHRIKGKRSLWERLSPAERDEMDRSLEAEARERLARFCRECGSEQAGEVLQGNPATVIPQTAEAWGTDLIVMGTRGLSYVENVLIGGTAEAVLKSSPCPVLVTR